MLKQLIPLLLLFTTTALAEDTKPVPMYPPTSYTIVLPVAEATTLMSIFPTAEMPQTHWGPVYSDIQAQIQATNTKAQQDKTDYDTAQKSATTKKNKE